MKLLVKVSDQFLPFFCPHTVTAIERSNRDRQTEDILMEALLGWVMSHLAELQWVVLQFQAGVLLKVWIILTKAFEDR